MEVESWKKRLLSYAMDWGVALLLTGIGFWLFSVWDMRVGGQLSHAYQQDGNALPDLLRTALP